MSLSVDAIRQGLTHRLICGLPPLVMAMAVLALPLGPLDAHRASLSFSALICAVLGFASPMILTEGLDKPMPSGRPLSLITSHTQKALLLMAIAVMTLPLMVRWLH